MLTIITASNDDASKVYIKKKIEACVKEGIPVKHVNVQSEYTDWNIFTGEDDPQVGDYTQYNGWGADMTMDEMLRHALRVDRSEGIILQLPLDPSIADKTQEYIDMIPPEKDVDCLTTARQGAIMLGSNDFLPCTTQAVLDMIKENTRKVKDECVHVVGRSNLVTKPLIVALINEGYTVRNWNSTHRDIDPLVASDLGNFQRVHFVSGAGVANLFDKAWYNTIKYLLYNDGAIEIYLQKNLYLYDIGMNRDEDGKLCGDIERGLDVVFQSEVPGGVGPQTVANVVKNYKKLIGENNEN